MKKRVISILMAAMLAVTFCLLVGCNIFDRSGSPPPAPHLISESQKESEPVRYIDSCEERAVVGSSFYERQLSLTETVSDGYKPTFDETSADAERVYLKAREVLDRYILNSFTEYERVHAIHDYLAYYTEYDSELHDRFLSGEGVKNDLDAFNLAGVLLGGKAVCDGISKTFVLLCGMEGIKAARIEGEFVSSSGSGAHAWNKVRVDGKWYNVDITLDSAHLDINGKRSDCLHHGYFLISDEAISSAPFGGHRADPSYAANPVNEDAPENYPVYENMTLTIDGENYSSLITTVDELKAVFKATRKSGRKNIGKLELKIAIEGVAAGKLDSFDGIFKAAQSELRGMDFTFAPEDGVRPFVQYPNGVLLILVYI